MQITDVCADDADVLALSILRSLMAGYVTGDVACWDMAHDGAERVLGADHAALLVAHLTRLVRVLRMHRSAGWHFMPVTCCRVTRDEQGLLDVLHAARGHDDDRATPMGSDLIGAEALPAFGHAIEAVAGLLNEIQSHGLIAGSRPRDRVVH